MILFLNFEAQLPKLLPESSRTDISLFTDFGNIWGIDYDKGSHLGTHSHGGYSYTFSYGVSVPKRSSTLIFPTSGRRVKQKEGQLVVFDSRLKHRVPCNKDEGRCILVGNFIYDWGNIDN